MSRQIRRKHVLKEMLEDDFALPKEDQQIVRIIRGRGNNLLEVEPADDSENFLVSIPSKFRKNLWMIRGQVLLVDPITEGNKVKGEVVKILTPEHAKEFAKHAVWPKKFSKEHQRQKESNEDLDEDDIPRNLNCRILPTEEEEEFSSSDDSDL